jgi:hypothetical protein
MFRHSALKGKIKVQDFVKLSEVEVTLYHKIKKYVSFLSLRMYNKLSESSSLQTTPSRLLN